MKKLFIVRKFIYANNAKDAIKKDLLTPVDEVWIDPDWKSSNSYPDSNPERVDKPGFKTK